MIEGHKLVKDIAGLKFGKLNVISFSHIEDNKRKASFWNCVCDCGNKKIIQGASLSRGLSKSCGICVMSKKNNPNWIGFEEISGTHWSAIKVSAEARGHKVLISIKEAWHQFIKQDRKCALSGVELYFNSKSNKCDGNASLDRISSFKDYEIGNFQWVTKDINVSKNNKSDKDFIDMCAKITDYQRSLLY